MQAILIQCLVILLPPFLLGVGAFTVYIGPVIRAHFKSKLAANGMIALEKAAATVVAFLGQTVVDSAKKQNAFTSEIALDVKAKGLAALKRVGAEAITQVAANGLPSLVTDAGLDHILEAAVADRKASSPPVATIPESAAAMAGTVVS